MSENSRCRVVIDHYVLHGNDVYEFCGLPMPCEEHAPDFDAEAVAALQTLMATHGHTLTPEQRAAVRGWLGRTA